MQHCGSDLKSQDRKEEKDLGVVIQDNLSPEKHIDRIFGDTFMMLRNIWMEFHFQDKDKKT